VIFEVVEELRPRVLGFADHDRVGVTRRFLGQNRGVNATEDDGLAPFTELGRHLVAASDIRGHGADADDVARLIEIEVLEVLFDELDLVPIRCQGGDDVQRELRQPKSIGSSLVPLASGRDQEKSHAGPPLRRRRR
jgi:hypothetical protein